jgi:uncharacterized protein (TIGR01777 family)
VHRLVRREARSAREISWDPSRGGLDPAALRGLDAVLNLGGAGLASRPWTSSYRDEILRSRTEPTVLLARTLASMPDGPRVLLQASAVGYYGDRGSEVLTETSARGTGFLADVVDAWEDAAGPAVDAGVRVVQLRTGSMALSRSGGGSSGLLLTAIRLGVGGPLGSGENTWSWITVPDHARAVHHLLESDVHGPVNLTAPVPARQRELIGALAAAVHRPALLRVPEPLLRLALRDVADDLLLSSQRALPTVLEASGFTWAHPTLADAAAWVAAQPS